MSHAIAYQPNAMRVELLKPESFVTAYDWTHDQQGNATPVLHARFTTDDGEFDAYAKPFEWGSREQSTIMLNEVTGWLLAKASGLPCAERAFFIQLPRARLPAYPGTAPLPPPDSHGFMLCFATQAVGNTAVRGLHNTQLLATEQSEWPHNDHTIAFDEGAGNPDRHVYNLVRRAPRDYVLIDHGYLLRILGAAYPTHWAPGALEGMATQAFHNVLHRNTYTVMGRNSPAACMEGCNRGLQFASTLRTALQCSMFEISFWCSRLLPGTSARWLHFLHTRMEQEPMAELLHQRFGLIPLHARTTL